MYKKNGKKKAKMCANKLIQVRREIKTKNFCRPRPPTHLLPSLYIGSPDNGTECVLPRIRCSLLVKITNPQASEHPYSVLQIPLSVRTLYFVWLLFCLYVEYYFRTVGSITHTHTHTHTQPSKKKIKHIHFLIKLWKIVCLLDRASSW